MNILPDRHLRIVCGASAAGILASLALIYVALVPSIQAEGGIFIVHFSSYRGIDLIGGLPSIIGLVLLGAAMIVADSILAHLLYARAIALSYILAYGGLAVSLLVVLFVGVVAAVN